MKGIIKEKHGYGLYGKVYFNGKNKYIVYINDIECGIYNNRQEAIKQMQSLVSY